MLTRNPAAFLSRPAVVFSIVLTVVVAIVKDTTRPPTPKHWCQHPKVKPLCQTTQCIAQCDHFNIAAGLWRWHRSPCGHRGCIPPKFGKSTKCAEIITNVIQVDTWGWSTLMFAVSIVLGAMDHKFFLWLHLRLADFAFVGRVTLSSTKDEKWTSPCRHKIWQVTKPP